jgi:membrane protein DedA with SNARE-associated domain
MLEHALSWLSTHEGALAYLLLAVAAAVEYVFPPFPGDTLTLFGVFLAVSKGFSPAGVYVSITAGSVVGGWLAYRFGLRLGDTTDPPTGLMANAHAKSAIDEIGRRFQQHGLAYLALNRFVPVLRAFFFVAAGIARFPVGPVLFWGALSALAWNALLFVAGWTVGHHWDQLSRLIETYSTIVLVVVLAGLVVFFVRRRAARSA